MKLMRDAFGEALRELGRVRGDIIVLDADLSSATRTALFGDEFPNRFFNAGISEANMVCIAAGFATCRKIPFACTFSFLLALRAADQIRSHVCYPCLNVKLVGTNGGLSGFGDGATHQCIKDIAVMQAMPGMTVIVPSDEIGVREAVFQAADYQGPVFIRVARVEAPVVHNLGSELKIGKGLVLKEGKDLTIVATGMMVHKALMAAEKLTKEGIESQVLEIHTVKPLDKQTLLRCVARTRAAVVVEEHNRYGGLFSSVAGILAENDPVPLEAVAIDDRFGESGEYEELLEACGLTIANIVVRSHRVIERKRGK